MPRKPKPRKFSCGPFTWTEQWIPRTDKRLINGADGVTWLGEKKIFYALDLLESIDEALLVVLHERLHAAWYSMGAPGNLAGEEAEQVVELLSRGLLQSLKKKPKISDL